MSISNNLKCEKFILSEAFENFLEESNEFKVKDLQTYFPIMNHFMGFYNNIYSHRNYVLNSRYKLINFLENEGLQISCDKGTENYKSYKSLLFDNFTKKNIEKNIFIKQSPVLDPLTKMMNDYPCENHNLNLPYSDKYWNKFYRKINDTNNATYVDCFFTFLGSKLVENNLCPNFPLYYGSYCGIAKEYEHDISEEFEEYKRNPWFIRGQKNIGDKESLFSLRYINNNDIDSENNSLCSSNITDFENRNDSSQEEEIDSSEISSNVSNENRDYECMSQEYDDLINNIKDKLKNDQCEIKYSETSGDNNCNEISSGLESFDVIASLQNSDNLPLIEIQDNLLKDIECVEDLQSIEGSVRMSDGKEIYALLKNFPVQLICMEKCEGTLEDIIEEYIEEYKNIKLTKNEKDFNNFVKEKEYMWESYILQICFALSVAQKQYNFTHNDLHSSNIMFVSTEDEFIYYHFENNYFAIPTFGKILKIIDFGRAIYTLRGKEYFSDVFELNNDAGGQYTYPRDRKKFNHIIYPNKSFDLCRLSTSIISDIYPEIPQLKNNGKYLSNIQKETESELFNLLYSWLIDRENKEITRYEEFELYKMIARKVKNAIPEKQLHKNIFKKFIINKEDINIKKGNLYNY